MVTAKERAIMVFHVVVGVNTSVHFRLLPTAEIDDLISCQMLRVAKVVQVLSFRIRTPLPWTD